MPIQQQAAAVYGVVLSVKVVAVDVGSAAVSTELSINISMVSIMDWIKIIGGLLSKQRKKKQQRHGLH